jgi:hypothetical protein
LLQLRQWRGSSLSDFGRPALPPPLKGRVDPIRQQPTINGSGLDALAKGWSARRTDK